MKILTVIGARPQFIKASPVSAALNKKGIKEILLHTGQHFDANMSDIFFEDLRIPKPDIFLDIHSGGHGAMTGRMLVAIEQALMDRKPDRVLVYGDTNSTLAGALAAVKMHIPVAHVEAGLRSFDMTMPEEINRILTDQVSNLLFCPTDAAIRNLQSEGIEDRGASIIRTGDVMADTLAFFRKRATQPLGIEGINQFILCTCHRSENTDDPERLSQIIKALNILHEGVSVIFPLHPRTQNAIKKQGLDLKVHTLPPVGYLEMLWLLDNCKLVITDSGGLQKEAYLMGKMCVTMRNQTEWEELIKSNVNVLAGATTETIVALAKKYIGQPAGTLEPLYGDGNTRWKIASALA